MIIVGIGVYATRWVMLSSYGLNIFKLNFMNYEYYEVDGYTYFSYADAYDAYCSKQAACMWGMTLKGNWAIVHNRELGF